MSQTEMRLLLFPNKSKDLVLPQSVQLIKQGPYSALIIQQQEKLFVYRFRLTEAKLRRISEENSYYKDIEEIPPVMDFEVKAEDLHQLLSDKEGLCNLNMLRAINDDVYCLVSQQQTEIVSLYRLKFLQDGQKESLSHTFSPVNTTTFGQVVAFESDALSSNDYNLNILTKNRSDCDDYVFIIDSQYMLSKVNVANEGQITWQIDLSEFESLRGQIDEYKQQRQAGRLVRMSISDRCITINGRTFNLKTGYEWSTIIQQPKDQELDFRWHSCLPNSNLMLTYVLSEKGTSHAFLLKNSPVSRELSMFNRGQHSVTMFEMIDKNNFIAQIKSGELTEETYWTMLNRKGQILDLDGEILSILQKKDWSSVQSHVWTDHNEQKKVTLVLMAQQIVKEKEAKTDGKVASDMTAHGLTDKSNKDAKQTADYSCMPEVCAIILDLKTRKMIHSRQFTKLNIFDAVFPRPTNFKGSAEEQWERTKIDILQAFRSHKIQCKVVVPDEVKVEGNVSSIMVYLVFPNIRSTKQEVSNLRIQEERFGYRMQLQIITTNKNQAAHFLGPDKALYIEKQILVKGPQGKILRLTMNDKNGDFFEQKSQKTLKAPSINPPGDASLLTQSSPFYSIVSHDAEVNQEDKTLQFPPTVQICYGQTISVCQLSQLDKLFKQDRANLDEYNGVEFLMDPESFVDFGVSLSQKICQDSVDREDEMIIWRHVQANKSQDYYFVSQSYWHRPGDQADIIYANDTRSFSFHGLYRKYSEADLFEAVRIKSCISRNIALKQFDKQIIFCRFKDSSIFSAYCNQMNFMSLIAKWLETEEMQSQIDNQDNEVEHEFKRKLMFQLQVHAISQQMQTDKQVIDQVQTEDKTQTCWQWFCDKLFSSSKDDRNKVHQLQKEQAKMLQQKLKREKCECNSPMYQSLYSDDLVARDLLLKIAGLCEGFSLADIFITVNDCKQVMVNPSQQIIQSLNSVQKITQKAKHIEALYLNAQNSIYYCVEGRFQMTQESMQQKVDEQIYNLGLGSQAKIDISVQISEMSLAWTAKRGYSLLELFEFLLDTKNLAVLKSNFVKSLLAAFWGKIKQRILLSLFIPFSFYLVTVLFLQAYCMQAEQEVDSSMFYYPLHGIVIVFMSNQILQEFTQLQGSSSFAEYISDIYNINDIIYLLMNAISMIVHFLYGSQFIEQQRIFAAVSSIPIWVKLFEWLRLFDATSFYLSLFKATIIDSAKFLVIVIVWLMAFGTAFYLVSLNRGSGMSADDQWITPIFSFWVFNAFEAMYELGLGEFSIDSYDSNSANQTDPNAKPLNVVFVYILFILATYLIQIVLMNMLIAIMGETLAEQKEQEQDAARLMRLTLLSEYVALIDNSWNPLEDEENETLSDEDEDHSDKASTAMAKIERAKLAENVSPEQLEIYNAKSPRKYLYQIKVAEEEDENHFWDGTVNMLRRHTRMTVQNGTKEIQTRIDKLQGQIERQDVLINKIAKALNV